MKFCPFTGNPCNEHCKLWTLDCAFQAIALSLEEIANALNDNEHTPEKEQR